MNKHLLTAKQLRKEYRQKVTVKDISLTVQSGEVVGLLGPNGAGKTTTFYMVVGLIQPNHGSITIDDTDLTSLPVHERAHHGLSYLPQEPSIFRKLTVSENILAILELQKHLSKQDQERKLEHLLDDFRIQHIRNNFGQTLSGGERRRVEIARALAMSPRFLLLDEPFAGIDPISIIDVKRIIQQLAQSGIGILITDHNVRDTLAICQRAYIVNEGSIICEGTPKEVTANPKVKEVYLGEDFILQ